MVFEVIFIIKSYLKRMDELFKILDLKMTKLVKCVPKNTYIYTFLGFIASLYVYLLTLS